MLLQDLVSCHQEAVFFNPQMVKARFLFPANVAEIFLWKVLNLFLEEIPTERFFSSLKVNSNNKEVI